MTSMSYLIRPGVLASICLLLCSLDAFGQQPIVVSRSRDLSEIGRSIAVMEDDSGDATIEQLVRDSSRFSPSTQDVPNFQMTHAPVWSRFTIANRTDQQLVLEIGNVRLEEITLYTLLPDGRVSEQVSGQRLPVELKPFKSNTYLLPLDLPTGATRTFILRVRTNSPLQFPLSVGTLHAFFDATIQQHTFQGMYFGFILLIVLYNLFLYITVRDHSYLYYILYVACFGLGQSLISGYTGILLGNGADRIVQTYPVSTASLSLIFLLLFTRTFLRTRQNTPKLHNGIGLFLAAFFITDLLELGGYQVLAYQSIQILALLVSLYLYAMAIIIYRNGYGAAKFYLMAWTVFLCGVSVFVLQDSGLIPRTAVTLNMMQIGSAIEVILLSFALADRIKIYKRQKEEAQAEALRSSEETRQLIAGQNVRLESKVAERTEELNRTLHTLKAAQSELVHHEKMSSLGQLTAGIAHEINNPINFVSSSIAPLRRDIEQVRSVVDRYASIDPAGNIVDELAAVGEYREEMEYSEIVEEISDLLRGIESGATRTSEIVLGLRTFSRLDEDVPKSIDLHGCIDSTVALLKHRCGERIEIRRQYDDLPDIECFPGQINQVFMNVMTNAIQAIDGSGTITIQTDAVGDNVHISIADTGEGMSDDVRTHVFEPFFTTRDVGKGTGLGLSISLGIVRNHNGEMSVTSIEGEGSTFRIDLPLSQAAGTPPHRIGQTAMTGESREIDG